MREVREAPRVCQEAKGMNRKEKGRLREIKTRLVREVAAIIDRDDGAIEVENLIVHVLHHGVTLCSMPGVPRDWPAGNRFVTVAEARAGAAHNINCEPCGIAYNTHYALKETDDHHQTKQQSPQD